MVPEVMLADGRLVKLGRISPKSIVRTSAFDVLTTQDGRTKIIPQLGNYFYAEKDAVPPPTSTSWLAKCQDVIRQTLGNTQQGDCVVASLLHIIGCWTANDSPAPDLSSDSEALKIYHNLCGPGDNGCVITDVSDAWVRGITVGGKVHKVDSYVSIDWTNKQLVQVAIQLFANIKLGINLPGQWTCTNCNWTSNASGNVGGHDVPVIDYNEQGVQVLTWGGLVTITWDAFLSRKWVEEAYVHLGPDWYGSDKMAPNGIDATTLAADLALIKEGKIPPLGPPNPVPTGNVLTLATALAPGSYAIGGAAGGLSPTQIAALQQADRVIQDVLAGRVTSRLALPPWIAAVLCPLLKASTNPFSQVLYTLLCPSAAAPCGGCK